MRKHLHNFFIPHEGNDYHPHILHTKRAFFYSTAFLITKIIVVGFALLLPAQVFVIPDVLQQQQSEIVALTNQVRESRGVQVLEQEGKLFTSSQHKADDMGLHSYFSHTSPNGEKLADFLIKSGYDYEAAGENLAVGFSSAEELIDAWIASPTHYNNLIDTDFQEFGVGLTAGSYEGHPVVYVASHFGSPKSLPEVEVAAEIIPEPVEDVPSVDLEPGVVEEIVEQPVETIPDPVELPLATEEIVEVVEKVEESELVEDLENTEDVSPFLTSVISQPKEEEQEVEYQPIEYDERESYLLWRDVGESVEVRAVAYLLGDVTSAGVKVAGETIELSPDESYGVYTGSVLVGQSSDELFRVVLTPQVDVLGEDGSVLQEDIRWQEPKIVSPTPVEKYTQSKKFLGSITSIFDISRDIYLFFAMFFAIVLFMNVLIEFKKQHHHVTVQTCGMILLLISLWMV